MIRNTSLFLVFILLFLNCSSGLKINISELKKTEYGKKFLKDHSEKELIIVIKFLNKPKSNFKNIKKVKNVLSYLEIYNRFCVVEKKEEVFAEFFVEHFTTLDDDKAEILTYLTNHWKEGMYGEIIDDKYTLLFKKYPKVLLKALQKIDWKQFIDRLGGYEESFREEIKKLGNSGFEKEVKEYVLRSIDKQENSKKN